MNTPLLRRAAGLLAGSALAASAVVAVPGSATAATPDPEPGTSGSSWLRAQLSGGLMPSPYGGSDVGLTIDAALSLQALGGHDNDVEAITLALFESTALDNYVADYSYTSADPFPDGPEATFAGHSSNATAKAAAYAAAVGADPESFGGNDLIAALGGMISSTEPTVGRLSDEPTKDGAPYPAGDYASTLGQSFAVAALDSVDSPLTDAATDFLLDQQCPAGFFRNSFAAPDEENQQCDAEAVANAGSVANTDATALAVLNLQSQLDDADVRAEVDRAVAWLISAQGADGSFGSEAPTSAPNANSTGLAGWALGVAGKQAPAERAAAWVRSVQAADPASCGSALSAQTGAIAYGPTELATARKAGLSTNLDQFRRASAQALAVLRYAPDNRAGLAVRTPEFAKAGSSYRATVTGLAPGQAVCVTVGGVTTWKTGSAVDLTVKAGAKTAKQPVRAAVLFGSAAATTQVLAPRKLRVDPQRDRIRKGRQQKVTVKGLAPGEKVVVRVSGTRVDSGKATRKGVFTATFKARGKAGKRTVRVVGQYATRTGKATFKVVR